MSDSTIAQRLTLLRQQMVEQQIDFYYVPSTDVHHNEYIPPCWQRRTWISGFDGSAGEVLVAADRAYLWTDGRYTLQAEQQLDAKLFSVMPNKQGWMHSMAAWLSEHAAGKTVGVDPQLMSAQTANLWQQRLADVDGVLKPIQQNLIDPIWQDQPALPNQPLCLYDIQYSGEDASAKLTRLREAMSQRQVDLHVLTQLDAIAWLFNIRGNDIQYNPVILSYAIVTQQQAYLFIDLQKVSSEQQDYFTQHKISLRPYEEFSDALADCHGVVLMDPKKIDWYVSSRFEQDALCLQSSPIDLMKSCKNKVEQHGAREAHRLDAIAMCRFLHWLENNWQGQTECSAAKKLQQFRLEDSRCRDLSFSTISGYGKNGAIIHYNPTEQTDTAISDNNLYLVDSGGQYFAGTTDITRTVHLGEPTAQQKRHYTLVLKGHLALRHTLFPSGVTGERLDAIARWPLWQHGLDYAHGTGHGVGCYLGVHEGPQYIAGAVTQVPLQPGMIVSNEPGYYLPGKYGIRIENLCLIVKQDDFYTFDDLTLVPYAKNLIDYSLLSQQEIDWIEKYHQLIYQTLKQNLKSDVRDWLKDLCQQKRAA